MRAGSAYRKQMPAGRQGPRLGQTIAPASESEAVSKPGGGGLKPLESMGSRDPLATWSLRRGPVRPEQRMTETTCATRYAGEPVANVTAIVVEIVRKQPNPIGFKMMPRPLAGADCGVVERFFARVNRDRRPARDCEASIASAMAFLHAACDMPLAARLARWV